MASKYREGAPVDDTDAASEGEPEAVVEAPPLEPEPAAKVAASEKAAPSHQQLLARTIHAEIHAAACGFMQLHAALPRRFGVSRSRASLSKLFSSWKETGKLADDISAYPCLEDMGYIVAECRFVLSYIDEKNWWPSWITAPRDHGRVRKESSDCGYTEQGNELWEALFYLAGFPTIVGQPQALATPVDLYGQRGNKSAKGSFNLHGNIIESVFGLLHHALEAHMRQTL